MNDLLPTLALGFVLGIRHATDADHVVAVTTVVSRERTQRAAIAIGAVWGMGHTATILAVGSAIVIFGLVVPPRVGLSLEMCVAVMLMILGATNLFGARRRAETHDHGPPGHHEGSHHGLRGMARPFVVGLVHGLAGSAAVALLVLATIRSPGWAALYLGIFGLGTILGMMILTSLMATPILIASKRFTSVDRVLSRVTGLISMAFGLFLAYRIGIMDGLLFGTPMWIPS